MTDREFLKKLNEFRDKQKQRYLSMENGYERAKEKGRYLGLERASFHFELEIMEREREQLKEKNK